MNLLRVGLGVCICDGAPAFETIRNSVTINIGGCRNGSRGRN